MVVEQRESYGNGSGMLTIKEVAGLLHAHPSSVRRWAKQGLIKCYRVGMRGDRRFKAEDVNEFVESGAITNGNGYFGVTGVALPSTGYASQGQSSNQQSRGWPERQPLSYVPQRRPPEKLKSKRK